MTPNETQELIRLLALFHKQEKVHSQGLPQLKVNEEAAEVLLASLQGQPTGGEEADLLFSLLLRHDLPDQAYTWAKKMEERQRTLFDIQRDFLHFLGV